jgi:ppGpp synthetase/RelA/SpoT-type nucleotidyltranferase
MNDKLLPEYKARYETILSPIAGALEHLIKDHVHDMKRIDRVSARAKSPDRFVAKASKVNTDGRPRYPDPYVQIQDQIGARVVVYYIRDVQRLSDLLMKYFRPIEEQLIVPDSEWEFGYFGLHYVLVLPKDAVPKTICLEDAPTFFELQIKTLFQHAWSEANHDLGYKPENPLDPNQKRLLAYTSAQAWGADREFGQLADELGVA